MAEIEIPGYQIEGVIGKGGMGVVYKATQIALDRAVAIKVLAPQLAADEDFVTDFAREAKITALLHHPHIVPVYDFGSFDGGFFLSMHYIEGRTLHQVLKVRRPAIEECVAIIRQISDALDFAHSKGVIHRDIKPSNIMLCNDGTAMLMDFGVAHGNHTPRLSDKGRAIGTPDYMSPEQCSARDLDHRCDIYALGAVLYQLLTGRPPFKGETKLAVMYQHVHAPPPSPRQTRPEISPQIEGVVLRALSKAPDRRYASAGAFAAALEAAFRAPTGTRAAPAAFQHVPPQLDAAAAAPPAPVVAPEPAPVPAFRAAEPVCLVGAAPADTPKKPPQLPIYYKPAGTARGHGWVLVGAIMVVCLLVIAGAAIYVRQMGAGSSGSAPIAHKGGARSSRARRAGFSGHHMAGYRNQRRMDDRQSALSPQSVAALSPSRRGATAVPSHSTPSGSGAARNGDATGDRRDDGSEETPSSDNSQPDPEQAVANASERSAGSDGGE